jgi:hypothetical protein
MHSIQKVLSSKQRSVTVARMVRPQQPSPTPKNAQADPHAAWDYLVEV